tara:strand:+ start:4281 stop:5600 length:1320 start_codon:yes stop_codon:yes gene_type:complete
MDWIDLLSLRRFGDKTKRIRKEQDETRLGFEVDYDRIVFSSAFRSLQDKTQVIPFSKTDFVHTRLTHSLEVSVVARTLGRLAGKEILNKHPSLFTIDGYKSNDFGAIVAAAALSHDIGNPPFGHSGEKAIGYFFSNGKGTKYKEMLSDAEYCDLSNFEGNANGFKILVESKDGLPGGLRLSYGTLGAFIKYPRTSFPQYKTQNISEKKFGVFQSELTFFEELMNSLKIQKNNSSYARHPLAFLVEAADDICYTIIDFEDGINLGWISESYALEYLLNLVRDQIDKNKFNSLKYKSDRMSYLRALAINSLIKESVSIFLENEDKILQGKYNKSLLESSKYKAQMEDIISLSVKKIYQSKEVVEKEVIGYSVINALMKVFTQASVNKFYNKENSFDSVILKLVPEGVPIISNSIYKTLLNTTCFIASLSDGKAMEISNKLK